MKNAIIYTLAFVVINLIASTIVEGISLLIAGQSEPITSTKLIIMAVLSSLTTIGVFTFLKWADVSRRYLLTRPWGVVFWCAIAACGVLIPSLCLQEAMPELPNLMSSEFEMIMGERWGYLAIGILAPIAEELVFRGAVLRALLRWNRTNHWVSIGFSALAFALVHANPAQMPHAFLTGLLLGWLYYRSGSIIPGVAFHWVNNSIAYIMYNLYPDPDIHLIDVLGSQRSVAAAFVFSLFILLPALFQLNLLLKRTPTHQ